MSGAHDGLLVMLIIIILPYKTCQVNNIIVMNNVAVIFLVGSV